MVYVDGFVLPVPKENLAAYRRMARRAGRIWREHGALEYRECVAEDLRTSGTEGPAESLFPAMVGLKRGETVVFSWIKFRSRAHRDRVNAKVMQDPRIERMMRAGKMPYDAKRMAYAGYQTLVEM